MRQMTELDSKTEDERIQMAINNSQRTRKYTQTEVNSMDADEQMRIAMEKSMNDMGGRHFDTLVPSNSSPKLGRTRSFRKFRETELDSMTEDERIQEAINNSQRTRKYTQTEVNSMDDDEQMRIAMEKSMNDMGGKSK